MDIRQKQPSITGRNAVLGNPAILEGVVREAIGDHFHVDPATIDLNQCLSGGPFNADGLDVMELGTEIMERLEFPIPKDEWERFLDNKTGTEPIRLRPAELVQLFHSVGKSLEQTADLLAIEDIPPRKN
jgi:acyl carrier protein